MEKTPRILFPLAIAAAALLCAAALPAAAEPLPSVKSEPSERVACTDTGDGRLLTWKRSHGTNRNRSIAAATIFVEKRLAKVQHDLDALAAEPPTPAILEKIARLENSRAELMALAASIPDCASGALFDQGGAPSFRFLCRFGFYAPAVATKNECSIDLSRRSNEVDSETQPSSWNLDAVAGAIDRTLAEACALRGGYLLRNTNLSAGAPMYSAFCAREGSRVATHYNHNTLVLGMEEEPTGDCIARHFSLAANDPCGGYGRPPAGGGGGDQPPPPDDGDCLIQRMEEEPTGCE